MYKKMSKQQRNRTEKCHKIIDSDNLEASLTAKSKMEICSKVQNHCRKKEPLVNVDTIYLYLYIVI